MSTILRSGKIIRCFSNASRAFLSSPKGYDNNLIFRARFLSAGFSQSHADNYSTQTKSIEPLLQRLDADVRRHGRISRRDLDEVLEEVRHKHSVSSSQSLLVIRCCGNLVPEELPSERTKLVEQIWETLLKRGIPLDISHYNALLRVYIENEHDFSPVAFLKDLEEKGLEPNRVTYQRLMWRHCQTGDVEGASRILTLMRDKELPLSGPVLDALVLGHTRQGDPAGARSVLEATRGAGLQPTPRTYAILVGGLAAQGDMDAVRQVLVECEKEELYLSDKDYMDIVEECAASGGEEHMEFFFNKMERGPGYNQDAINLILRLLNRSKDRAALKVLHTMTASTGPNAENPSDYRGAFFVRQLVKVAGDPATVLLTLNNLVAQDLCPAAHSVALDIALQSGKEELALALMKELTNIGKPIRQHYFWPLYAAKGRQNDREGLLRLVSVANTDFQMGPSAEALREYVAPHLGSDPDRVVDLLRKVGVSVGSASRTVILNLLSDGKIAEAARLASKYSPYLNIDSIIGPLTSAFAATGDSASYIALVHRAYPDTFRVNLPANEEQAEETPTGGNRGGDPRSIAGRFLLAAVTKPPADPTALVGLMNGFLDFGFAIGKTYAERIQERLGAALTPQTSELLVKLTSEDLELVPAEKTAIPSIAYGVEQLERLVANAETKGDNPAGLKRQLLMAYIRGGQTDKLEALLKKLDDEGYVLTSGTLAIIMDWYVQKGDLERALHYETVLRAKDPEFTLDSLKVVRLADLLLQNDRDEEATQIICNNVTSQEEKTFRYNTSCWKLLDSLAERGDPDKLQTIFDLLLDKGYIEINNSVLGPLIKVHLQNNNSDEALNAFEKCCQTHRCTPWKSELTRKLIMSEDATGLQRLTDLSTSVHGEVNSLYDLMFGFVECGRLRQARRILETPGLRTKTQRFNSVCERYGLEGKIECLEGLLEATKELSHIDRTEMFQQLLLTYIRNDDADKALSLWTLLQEESVAPTDKFLTKLGKFLQSKNIAVPFAMPFTEPQVSTPIASVSKSKTNIAEKTSSDKNENNLSVTIINLLKAGDLEGALSKKVNSESGTERVSRKCIHLLAKHLIIAGRAEQAEDLLVTSMREPSLLDVSVLQLMVNTLAKDGKVDAIIHLGERLTSAQRQDIMMENRLCEAYHNSGKSEQYLDLLVSRIESAAEETLPHVKNTFPKGSTLKIITNDPGIIPKYEEMAKKYADRGITYPYNMLWMHHIIDGNKPEADRIWQKFNSISEMILFKNVVTEASKKNDPKLLETLLDYLSTNDKINPRALAVIYSRQIDIHTANGSIEEGYNVIEKATRANVPVELLHTAPLQKLKAAMEATGTAFKYTIPTYVKKGSVKNDKDV